MGLDRGFHLENVLYTSFGAHEIHLDVLVGLTGLHVVEANHIIFGADQHTYFFAVGSSRHFADSRAEDTAIFVIGKSEDDCFRSGEVLRCDEAGEEGLNVGLVDFSFLEDGDLAQTDGSGARAILHVVLGDGVSFV